MQMTAAAQKTADLYTRMLLPLERTVKLTLINRLSASLLQDEADEIQPEPKVNLEKKAAYEALLSDAPPLEVSLNGQKEAAACILRKYESLN